jgi:glycine cleavage system aminomethyltransferase T/glycine/D-amino acid oxidase-like deaminating enzyme
MQKDLPQAAQVVIIGGGIVGCSIAYHLGRLGMSDVLLIEQNQLTSGTTWHAAGLVGQLRATRNLTRLAKYTTGLFSELEAITGQATGFRTTGSISVALNAERFEELQRQATSAAAFGVNNEVISGSDVAGHWPGVVIDDILGAVYLPDDGQTNPVDTTLALARGARDSGVLIVEGVSVTAIATRGETITGVETEAGPVKTGKVVIAAGMWSRQLAAQIGVVLPLHAAEHFYIVTQPVEQLRSGAPTLRVPDECAYFKEDAGKLLLGCFEPLAKPWGMEGIGRDFSFGTLPEDIDHFAPILEQAVRRFPILESTGIQLFFNGPESFTPDDRYLLGETMEYRHLYVAAGFNSIGIQSSGGAGKVLAEWIDKDHPPMNLFDIDIRRVFKFQDNDRYLFERTKESLGLLYAMHWPHRQYETARGIHQSPIHQDLVDQGAVMGEMAGWERPNWFTFPNQPAVYLYSYGRQNWFENCRSECHAVRDGVALFDQTSYPVFLVKGPDAMLALNMICANNIDVAIDRIVYTQWLNERGGIEADVTLTRLADDEFMIVSSCATENRDFHWLRRHIPPDMRVSARNVSTDYAMFGLMGPGSRELLQQLTDTPVDNNSLPFYSSQELRIGSATVRANRLTYVGELGFELYVPRALALSLYRQLRKAGQRHGLRLAGFHAMNACRMEKSYKHMGEDISDDIDPFSSGLGFAVDMNKHDFIGKSALALRQKPSQRRLVNLAIQQDDAPLMIHDEPVYLGKKLIGLTTSAMWGHRVNRSLAIALINCPDGLDARFLAENRFSVEIARQRYPVEIRISPFYDPKSLRVKG